MEEGVFQVDEIGFGMGFGTEEIQFTIYKRSNLASQTWHRIEFNDGLLSCNDHISAGEVVQV